MLLVRYDVRSYMHIFFTVKNTLVLLLMFYRLFVLFEAKRALHLEARKNPEIESGLRVKMDGEGEFIDLDEVKSWPHAHTSRLCIDRSGRYWFTVARVLDVTQQAHFLCC